MRVPGARLIPLDELRDRVDELPAGPVVVHCAVGVRGHTAVRLLTQLGRDAVNLDGGYRTWAAGQASSPQWRALAPLEEPVASAV